MSTATRPPLGPAIPPLPVHRFTVAQYQKMIATGVLSEDDRVELLDGWIVAKMPTNPPHASAIRALQRRFEKRLPDDWLVSVQSPIELARSMPEPDLAVIRGPEDRFRDRHPRPPRIALVVEVSDTSLDSDRRQKGPLYAGARIPVYWIVDLGHAAIEVYSQPRGGKLPGYRRHEVFGREDDAPLIIDGEAFPSIPVREVLVAR